MINSYKVCENCEGKGYVYDEDTLERIQCPECKGKGKFELIIKPKSEGKKK